MNTQTRLPSSRWGRHACGTITAESLEWLVTNGLGGYASGTVAGLNSRRYHGLLVSAQSPPLGRIMMVSRMDEVADYAGRTWPLFTNRWRGDVVQPHGYELLESFALEGTTPVWTYAVADALLEKRVFMSPGRDTTHVTWRLVRGTAPLTLRIKVMVGYRDHHATSSSAGWRMRVEPCEPGVRVTAYDGATPILLASAAAEASPRHTWHHQLLLSSERERGFPYLDDILHVATFTLALEPGEEGSVVCSTEEAPELDPAVAYEARQAHERRTLERYAAVTPEPPPATLKQLALAADQFIVHRPVSGEPDGTTILAGYPWFGDWGRDTMISLPGLTLATGRAELAASILRTSAQFVDRGMLPNRFPDDEGEQVEYNTVDATLWYITAIARTFEATGDAQLIEELWPVLESIIAHHAEGTRYGIGVDPSDGLLRAGEEGVQLTWMDARVEGRVITPRMGKPVEVNALWLRALDIMVELSEVLGRDAATWRPMAEAARRGFARFFNPELGYCYDVLDGPGGHDATLRPNQILAVSLPNSPLTAEQQRSVVSVCARRLLASAGLRSLDPEHPDYAPAYRGSPDARDAVYHQGTAWGWLLGPFAEAHLRVFGDRAQARRLLQPALDHLRTYGIGSVAEIFDGDAPHTPRGCIAQAWSVAEVLRAWRLTCAAD
ncbi:MAG: glycogen debranching protein [Myxococcales bacterium]|nr:glycogen debranching protein [Myxococcales bacterium]